jgi:hypothetical protein
VVGPEQILAISILIWHDYNYLENGNDNDNAWTMSLEKRDYFLNTILYGVRNPQCFVLHTTISVSQHFFISLSVRIERYPFIHRSKTRQYKPRK